MTRITLYHGTTRDAADSIRHEGFWAYVHLGDLATARHYTREEWLGGDEPAILSVTVDASRLQYDGECDYFSYDDELQRDEMGYTGDLHADVQHALATGQRIAVVAPAAAVIDMQ